MLPVHLYLHISLYFIVLYVFCCFLFVRISQNKLLLLSHNRLLQLISPQVKTNLNMLNVFGYGIPYKSRTPKKMPIVVPIH